ncbi:hypothetical protein ACIBG8_07290 [Nonomuraea sp. NPDC050556]|uniref:hypothetical protein n=1 Tax=Nonomuraea sp. NPDC050556 TaxID=3364369 RepID=UPI00379BDFD9
MIERENVTETEQAQLDKIRRGLEELGITNLSVCPAPQPAAVRPAATERPAGGRRLVRRVMAALPPRPDIPVTGNVPRLDPGQWARIVLLVVCEAALVGGALALLGGNAWMLSLSAVALPAAGLGWFLPLDAAMWIAIGVQVACTILWFVRLSRQDNESAAASRWDATTTGAFQEEAWFRLGAERWTRSQRTNSTLLFGLVHLTWYLPLMVAVLPALGGVLYMSEYLRGTRADGQEQGMLRATAVHAAYNRYGIAMLGGLLVLGFAVYAVVFR